MENKQKNEFISIINLKMQKNVFRSIIVLITLLYCASTIIILPIAYFITKNMFLIETSSIISICSSFILLVLAQKIMKTFPVDKN